LESDWIPVFFFARSTSCEGIRPRKVSVLPPLNNPCCSAMDKASPSLLLRTAFFGRLGIREV
jgi:hypothetical protein